MLHIQSSWGQFHYILQCTSRSVITEEFQVIFQGGLMQVWVVAVRESDANVTSVRERDANSIFRGCSHEESLGTCDART